MGGSKRGGIRFGSGPPNPTPRAVTSLLLNTIALDPNRWTAEKQPYFALEAILGLVAAAGFHALEVWQYHLSTLDGAAVEALGERTRSLKVTFPIVGMYPALDLEGEAEAREWAVVRALMQRAERLGARGVKVFAGRLGSADASAAAYRRSIAFARRLVALAGEHDLAVTAETHPDTLCDSVPATRRFLDAVADERLRLCYQPFDFASTERAVADYRALAERVTHVHLQGRRGGQISLLEEADIDYGAFLSTLEADGFSGDLSIEFVKGCVVDRPAAFSLDRVLAQAQRDRAFVEAAIPSAA